MIRRVLASAPAAASLALLCAVTALPAPVLPHSSAIAAAAPAVSATPASARSSAAAGAPAPVRSSAATAAPASVLSSAAAAAPALTDSLRLDPAVRTGRLSNGPVYFIRQNHKPEARVALRLVVAAGSNEEADDQQGFAHFCEHMSFNGTAHFKPEEMVAYLQSIGMRFGADANAYTSFDETVYMLEVPTDRDTLLDRGLVALSDFAGRATLSDVEIEKERGVVLEEWRLGRGAGERIQRKQIPALYHGSLYAERLPIGRPEIIQKGPAARLRDFYHDFYRPDYMAVVAVGDIEPARMDSLIRVHFADLPAPRGLPVQNIIEIPLHQETLVAIASDKEATGSSVAIVYKHPREPVGTVGDYRRGLIEGLFASMLNERFGEIAHRADPPFLSAGAGGGSLGRTLDTWRLGASVADGGIEKGLAALLEEEARVRQHGFLAGELERARERMLKWNESAYAERDKMESDVFASSYVQVILTGEPAPGIEAAHALTNALIGGITLDEVSALAPRLFHDHSRVVLVTTPEKPGVATPTEAAVRAVLAKSARAKVAAWEDKSAGKTLMARLPEPGTVRSRRVIDAIGVTVLALSNGVEVWLKPTDFKADEISFSGYAPGGFSVADSAGFTTAMLAEAIVNDAGLGGFTSVELQKLLAGRIAFASPFANPYTHGVLGMARPADLETALQLAHLAMTRPTVDRDAFGTFKQRTHARLADRANSPEQVFSDTVTAVNTGGFYMSRPLTDAALDAVALGAALDVHRKRFANAADFTFFMVGAFQPDSVAPLLARYLGSLPSTGRRTATYAARGPRYPESVRTVQVRRGIEPKSSTRITFFVNGGLEELDLHRARACASILTDRLRQSLREMLGGTYSASASFTSIQPLPGYQTMTIAFGCDPQKVDTMVATTLAEIRKLRDEGPSLADVQKDQEIERRELEVALKENSFWIGSLQTVHLLGWDPLRILKRRERIDLLTPENLRATFVKYFPLDRHTVITLLPETGAGGGGK